MKYFAVAALMAVIKGLDVAPAQAPGLAQIKSHPVSQVRANLQQNFFTQLLKEKAKIHVCDWTA